MPLTGGRFASGTAGSDYPGLASTARGVFDTLSHFGAFGAGRHP